MQVFCHQEDKNRQQPMEGKKIVDSSSVNWCEPVVICHLDAQVRHLPSLLLISLSMYVMWIYRTLRATFRFVPEHCHWKRIEYFLRSCILCYFRRNSQLSFPEDHNHSMKIGPLTTQSHWLNSSCLCVSFLFARKSISLSWISLEVGLIFSWNSMFP